MSKSHKSDVTELLLKGHKRGIKKAIDIASRTKTSLIVEKNDKIVAIKPTYKYVRVPIKTAKKKLSVSRKKTKCKT